MEGSVCMRKWCTSCAHYGDTFVKRRCLDCGDPDRDNWVPVGVLGVYDEEPVKPWFTTREAALFLRLCGKTLDTMMKKAVVESPDGCLAINLEEKA